MTRRSFWSGVAALVLLATAGGAAAQANLDIDTPAIRSLTASLQQIGRASCRERV